MAVGTVDESASRGTVAHGTIGTRLTVVQLSNVLVTPVAQCRPLGTVSRVYAVHRPAIDDSPDGEKICRAVGLVAIGAGHNVGP